MSVTDEPPFFLGIPREIRDVIYEQVLLSLCPPPSSPTSCRDTYRAPDRPSPNETNIYPSHPPQASGDAMLLVNHQICNEVLATTERLKSSKAIRYSLDCMVENETRILPTWTCVPVSTVTCPHIDFVDVTFRLFGSRSEHSPGWLGSVLGPSCMCWNLYSLIERFLANGCNWLNPPEGDSRPKVTIGTINIDVVSPPEPPEGFTREKGRSPSQRVLHPEMVFRQIKGDIIILLSKGRETKPYARVLYERVTRIKMGLDGDVGKEWDLVAAAALSGTGS